MVEVGLCVYNYVGNVFIHIIRILCIAVCSTLTLQFSHFLFHIFLYISTSPNYSQFKCSFVFGV